MLRPAAFDNPPGAIDNDYKVCQAYANHYWPALYFVDTQAGSGITASAKAITSDRRWSSGNYWVDSELTLLMNAPAECRRIASQPRWRCSD